MAITKDNALHSISIHFNEMVKIVMRQLDIMDKLFVDHTIQIPSELQEEIKENEDKIA